MEIHETGGGIQFTVSKTTDATEDILYELLKDRIKVHKLIKYFKENGPKRNYYNRM